MKSPRPGRKRNVYPRACHWYGKAARASFPRRCSHPASRSEGGAAITAGTGGVVVTTGAGRDGGAGEGARTSGRAGVVTTVVGLGAARPALLATACPPAFAVPSPPRKRPATPPANTHSAANES